MDLSQNEVETIALWLLTALALMLGTAYCMYTDTHIDEKLGVKKGMVKLVSALMSGVFLSLLAAKMMSFRIPSVELASTVVFFAGAGQSITALVVGFLPRKIQKDFLREPIDEQTGGYRE